MISRILAFIRFYLQAQTKYRVHSPSIYTFVMDVIEGQLPAPDATKRIETIRKDYHTDQTIIEINDLGAGSNSDRSNRRSIASIAKSAVSNRKKCHLLYRIARYYEPNRILELGTSLGVATAYLAQVSDTTTIEGCPNISRIAQKTVSNAKAKADFLVGDIEQQLDILKQASQRFDLVFADGNHQKSATLQYFESIIQLLPNASGIIVFDDIYWSEGMTEGWETIKEDPRVTKSIDLFTMGIVYIGHEVKQKEHYTLIASMYKPWQTGLFKSA